MKACVPLERFYLYYLSKPKSTSLTSSRECILGAKFYTELVGRGKLSLKVNFGT